MNTTKRLSDTVCRLLGVHDSAAALTRIKDFANEATELTIAGQKADAAEQRELDEVKHIIMLSSGVGPPVSESEALEIYRARQVASA